MNNFNFFIIDIHATPQRTKYVTNRTDVRPFDDTWRWYNLDLNDCGLKTLGGLDIFQWQSISLDSLDGRCYSI